MLSGIAGAQTDIEPVVVIEVGDPLDQRLLDYVEATIETETAHLFILKINSPGVSSGDVSGLYDAVLHADAPVVSWIGPSPAVAFGGSAYLAHHADIRSAAPGSSVGYLEPNVLKGAPLPPSVKPGADPDAFFRTVGGLLDTTTEVVGPEGIVGFVDRVDPALGQLIVGLDGEVVERGDGRTFEIQTAGTVEVNDETVVSAIRPVRFVSPGILDRILHLGSRPETAFLFLTLGLAFAAFEFYAAGTGLMAFVAAISLTLSGYGMATLPMWWPSIAVTLGGFAFLVWGFIQNRVDWRMGIGAVLLLVGGLTFASTRPQFAPSLWMVILAVAATTLFTWYSLTTVVRGRFATPTVGREEMIGQRCLVIDTLDPFGVVIVEGARWQASADRGVIIMPGAPAEIVGVTGQLLEVDPVVSNPESPERE